MRTSHPPLRDVHRRGFFAPEGDIMPYRTGRCECGKNGCQRPKTGLRGKAFGLGVVEGVSDTVGTVTCQTRQSPRPARVRGLLVFQTGTHPRGYLRWGFSCPTLLHRQRQGAVFLRSSHPRHPKAPHENTFGVGPAPTGRATWLYEIERTGIKVSSISRRLPA